MRFYDRRRFYVILTIALVIASAPTSFAAMMTYTMTGNVVGSLNGVHFGNPQNTPHLSITLLGDTKDVTHPTSDPTQAIIPGVATFSIDGVSSGTFLGPSYLHRGNNDLFLFSPLNTLVFYIDLGLYDFKSPIGPINVFSVGNFPFSNPTDRGNLVFDNVSGVSTFTAASVPLPASCKASLPVLVGLWLISRKKRARRVGMSSILTQA
jgi:hypothetical protein